MTEQELREKIKKAIKNGFQKADCRKPYTNEPYPYFDSQINSIANALISAGIGDVSEWKNLARLWELTSLQYQIERDEYKHRAEVAERAVREFAVQVGCRSCPFNGRCEVTNPNCDYEECYKSILYQAEKELQEERKDD